MDDEELATDIRVLGELLVLARKAAKAGTAAYRRRLL